jgi:hypothetical protein
MNDEIKGGPKEPKSKVVTLKPASAKGPRARAAEFEKFKDLQTSRVLGAIWELQEKKGMTQEQAIHTLIELEESEAHANYQASLQGPNQEPERDAEEGTAGSAGEPGMVPGTLSNIKGWALGLVDSFAKTPLRFIIAKSIKASLVAAPVYGASSSGIELYSNPEIRTTYQFLLKAWNGIAEGATYVAGGLYDNASMAIYAFAGALLVSALKKDTRNKKFSRVSYSSGVLSAPFILQDITANADAGLKGIENILDLSALSNTLVGITFGTFLLSKIVPNKPHDEFAATAEQVEKKQSLFSRVSTGFWWGIYNGIGAVFSALSGLASRIREKIPAGKAANAAAPALTQTMPIEMMPGSEEGVSPGEKPEGPSMGETPGAEHDGAGHWDVYSPEPAGQEHYYDDENGGDGPHDAA